MLRTQSVDLSSLDLDQSVIGEARNRRFGHVLFPGLAALLLGLLALAAVAQAAGAYAISGTVKAQSTGLGVAETQVIVRDATSEAQVAATQTAADGSYSVEAPGGTYDIEFAPPLGSEYQSFAARDEPVNSDLTLNVTLVPSDSVTVSGTVRNAAGEALPNMRVLIFASSGPGSASAQTNGKGEFTTTAIAPGSYNWAVYGSRSQGAPASMPNEYTLSGAGFTVTSGQREEITLPRLHTLTVRTVGPGGDPIAGVRLNYDAGGSIPQVAVAPGMEATEEVVDEETATNSEGKGLLPIPNWTASKPVISVSPPSATQLLETSFETPGLTEDQTRLIAFGKSGTDVTPPEVKCSSPSSGWHSENQTLACTSADSGTGLARPEDASFSVSTTVALGEESANAQTDSRRVCDKADNCAEAGPFGPIEIDRKAPTISIASPTNGAEVAKGSALKAQYTCPDGGSGTVACEGSTPSGGALDTTTLGKHTLTVSSTDAVGNHSSASASYIVVQTDTTPPTISIVLPEDGVLVNKGAQLAASYSCADSGSGVASCEGSIPSGAALDTSVLGEHTLSVAANDHAGNASSRTVHYTVVEPGECGESAVLCQTGIGDETPPTVASLGVSPASVDTSASAKSVSVTVQATDDLSGVSAIQVSLSNGSRWVGAAATLSSGTRLHGTWNATLTLPKGSAAGTYALTVALIDNIGNHRTYTSHELETLGFPSAVTETGAGDTTPPQLSGATASPQSVSTCSTTANTAVGVQASDSSGVSYVNVYLTGPHGQSLSAGATLDGGSATSGHWSASLTLPQHAEQGAWAISIQTGDTAGNSTYISSAQLTVAGFAGTIEQTCPGDTRPPQIAGVTLLPESLDTSGEQRSVVVDVHATDDLSGVASLQGTLSSGGQSRSATASLSSGTSLDGTWQATVTLPRWSQQGTWQLSLTAADRLGNAISLSPSQISALGLPSSIEQSGEGDSAPPSASKGSISPNSFDTSQHAVPITVRVPITDDKSGTQLVRVEFTSPSGTQHVYGEASLTKGTPQSGEWTATLEFPQFSQQGSWSPRLELWDGFGNRRTYNSAELSAQGIFPTLGISPEPEFGRCVKAATEKVGGKTAHHGAFTSSNCVKSSETHTGAYEWVAGVERASFTTKIKELTKITLATVKATKITCTGETGTGEYTGLRTVGHVVLTLSGCELTSTKAKCATAGAVAGELVTQPLEGVLGIDALGTIDATNKIGLELYATGRTGPVMSVACGASTIDITGSFITPVPADKMLTTSTEHAAASKGIQNPASFLGGPLASLFASVNGGTPERAGVTMTLLRSSEEAVEINTVV